MIPCSGASDGDRVCKPLTMLLKEGDQNHESASDEEFIDNF